MSDPDILIRVRGLKNVFGPHVVHEDLDLDVRRGEIMWWAARARANRC
jgi:phospholipid/cholesterol/gamma-HCH transport system ATP-binding protein